MSTAVKDKTHPFVAARFLAAGVSDHAQTSS